MNMPGFTAEASLYNPRTNYRMMAGEAASTAEGVVPAAVSRFCQNACFRKMQTCQRRCTSSDDACWNNCFTDAMECTKVCEVFLGWWLPSAMSLGS